MELREIQELMRCFDASGLTALEVSGEGTSLRMEKAAGAPAPAAPTGPAPMPAPIPSPAKAGVEAILCAMALREGWLPPAIHYRVPDPECALDVVPNAGREATITAALSNSLGFGGRDAALVLGRYKEV